MTEATGRRQGGWRWASGTGAAAGLAVLAGCSSPLYDTRDDELRRSIQAFGDRELKQAREYPGLQELDRTPRAEALQISKDILEQIQRTTGPAAYSAGAAELSPDLHGQKQQTIRVNLQRAILTGVQNNLGVQFARLGPALSETRIAAAEAAFDWTLFGAVQYGRTNEPRVVTTSGVPTEQDSKSVSANAGLRKRMITGGQFTAQGSSTLNKDMIGAISNGFGGFNYNPTPNPAKQTDLTFLLEQPLLKNFGSDVNLAQVRVARNAAREQVQQLKQTLIGNVVGVEEAYWALVASFANLQINQKLLERGLEVQQVLQKRRDANLDVKQSQLSDAIAQVESRRSDVIRAENQVRIASDRLKQLLNDPAITVGSETLIQPLDTPVDQSISFSLIECMATALNNRPEVQRALLGIDDASIRMAVANNLRLPDLNMRAQVRLTGQRDSWSRAVGDVADADYLSYLVGVNFEQPIGNRGPEAEYKAKQLERMQSVITYKDVAQRIIGDVKEKLRVVESNYKLIEQTRAARIAAAENVRSLLVEEQNLVGLTPEFLDLKLRRQQSLAQAEIQEIVALTDYNAAVARLYGSMGTALERNKIEFRSPTIEEALAMPTSAPGEPLRVEGQPAGASGSSGK